jgi:hypothetical protein
MRAIAVRLIVTRMAERDRAEAERQISDASGVAEDARRALQVVNARLASAHVPSVTEREAWSRLSALLGEAHREASGLVDRSSQVLRKPWVAEHSSETRSPGRPDERGRSRFVREAQVKLRALHPRLKPSKALEVVDWVMLGIAVGIEEPGDDYDNLWKSYSDLLTERRKKPRRPKPNPGNARGRKVSRAR